MIIIYLDRTNRQLHAEIFGLNKLGEIPDIYNPELKLLGRPLTKTWGNLKVDKEINYRAAVVQRSDVQFELLNLVRWLTTYYHPQLDNSIRFYVDSGVCDFTFLLKNLSEF